MGTRCMGRFERYTKYWTCDIPTLTIRIRDFRDEVNFTKLLRCTLPLPRRMKILTQECNLPILSVMVNNALNAYIGKSSNISSPYSSDGLFSPMLSSVILIITYRMGRLVSYIYSRSPALSALSHDNPENQHFFEIHMGKTRYRWPIYRCISPMEAHLNLRNWKTRNGILR